MPIFYTEELPNDKWRFEIYVNTKKLTAAQIVSQKKCTRIINLGYFDLERFKPVSGLIVGGKVLQTPEYHDWGITIDTHGNLSRGVPLAGAGALNWCPAQPPMLKGGKRAASAQSFGRNGTTMVGFKADGTPVWLTCLKSKGRIPLLTEGATSKEAVDKLVSIGCVDVLRYDGSWSTQDNMHGVWHLPGQYRVVYTLLLAYPRNETKATPSPTSPTSYPVPTRTLKLGCSGEDVKWLQYRLNQKIGAGLPVNGGYWNLTEAAVRVFQQRNGLDDDGVAGPLTRKVLLQ